MRVVKWALSCILKIVTGLYMGWGKIWSWHALHMVCCHTELFLQMAYVRRMVYRVTFVSLGEYVTKMACWKVWKLSTFVCSPNVLYIRCRFVTLVSWSLGTS